MVCFGVQLMGDAWVWESGQVCLLAWRCTMEHEAAWPRNYCTMPNHALSLLSDTSLLQSQWLICVPVRYSGACSGGNAHHA